MSLEFALCRCEEQRSSRASDWEILVQPPVRSLGNYLSSREVQRLSLVRLRPLKPAHLHLFPYKSSSTAGRADTVRAREAVEPHLLC